MTPTTSTPPTLRQIGTQAPLREYLAEIWSRREFATHLPLNNLRAQNRDTVLGNIWHLANPALQIAIYYLIFGVILDTTMGVDNFLAFLTIGIFVFNFSQKTVMEASTAIIRNGGLIRSIYFPRAVLPFSTAIGQTLAYGPSVLVMFITLFLTGEEPRWAWVAFPAILLLQAVTNLGFSFVVARATDQLRDITQVLPHVFRLLFYFSGVMFSVEAFISSRPRRLLFDLNPMYVIIELNRWSMLSDPLARSTLVAAFVWALVSVIGGFFYFRAAEYRYGRV